MRFVIEQGYFNMTGGGWVASDNGSLFAIIRVDEEYKQIGSAEAVIDLDDIPKELRKMMAE